MYRFKFVFKVLLTCVCLALIFPMKSNAADQLKEAEKRISYMRGSLDRVADMIRKAVEKSDIALVNCLRKKEERMKKYYDISTGNQENLRLAWKTRDMASSDRFLKLIDIAYKQVKGIEPQLKQCYGKKAEEEETKVIVVKPEGTLEEAIEDLFPEENEEVGEGLPAVPPASPFR